MHGQHRHRHTDGHTDNDADTQTHRNIMHAHLDADRVGHDARGNALEDNVARALRIHMARCRACDLGTRRKYCHSGHDRSGAAILQDTRRRGNGNGGGRIGFGHVSDYSLRGRAFAGAVCHVHTLSMALRTLVLSVTMYVWAAMCSIVWRRKSLWGRAPHLGDVRHWRAGLAAGPTASLDAMPLRAARLRPRCPSPSRRSCISRRASPIHRSSPMVPSTSTL
jgi:hypothetical protein